MKKDVLEFGHSQPEKWEEIYYNENPEKPKELFKSIVEIIKNSKPSTNFRICDVGCAAGAFLAYTKKVFPDSKIFGMDISNKLISKASKIIPQGEFVVESIENNNAFADKKFDIITLKGVLSIFDDPETILMNCISALDNNGVLIVTGIFNPDPIDVVFRYRKTDKKDSTWEKGLNIHSCFNIEEILKNSKYDLDINWHRFSMPFSLERQEDPMRAWTTQIGDNPYATINGACQIHYMMNLEIHVKNI